MANKNLTNAKKAKKDESLFKIKACNPLEFILEEVFKNA